MNPEEIQLVADAAAALGRCATLLPSGNDGWADTVHKDARRWSGRLAAIGRTVLDPALCAPLAAWLRSEVESCDPSVEAVAVAHTILEGRTFVPVWRVTCGHPGCDSMPVGDLPGPAAAMEVVALHVRLSPGHQCTAERVIQ